MVISEDEYPATAWGLENESDAVLLISADGSEVSLGFKEHHDEFCDFFEVLNGCGLDSGFVIGDDRISHGD